jgi:nucleoside-diphosphate-sugar epimerase
MFKSAMSDGQITINNPSIWRPILDVRDTSMAFLRAVQASSTISGVFNVASGNFTVGQIGDMVKDEIETRSGRKIKLNVKDLQDFRNYKVTCERARLVLGFLPKYSIDDIVGSLYDHLDEFGDFSADEYYNIKVFRSSLQTDQTLRIYPAKAA